jgi:hypothetical protein
LSPPEEKQDSYASAVAAQLFQTQNLIQTLLVEIRENSSAQAQLNADLKYLRINVQMLLNIIRGDDGNTKPLVMEVEVLKHADIHHDKRMTEIVKDFEDQIVSLSKNLSEMTESLSEEIKAEETKRIAYETTQLQLKHAEKTQQLQLEHADKTDIRFDTRTRLQTWSTVILAILSLIGSTLAILLK